MDIKLIVAAIGIVGILASAFVQFVLGRLAEKNKKAHEIRTQAYLDLINSVSDIASTSKFNEGKIEPNQLKNLTSAKSRVVLIGSDDVVIQIHKYFLAYEKLDSNESYDAFSNIVSAMRKDLISKSNLEQTLLTEALFGKDKN